MKKVIGCCSSAFISIVLLIVLAVCGGSFYLFSVFVQPIIKISLIDTIGIYNGLNKSDEGKINNNPFDKDIDLASFEKGFREALFISEGSDFSIKDIITEALDGTVATPPEADNKVVNQADIKGNKFLSFLERIDFDFSSLKNYSGDETKGVLTVSDKEVAAMVNAALGQIVNKLLPEGTDKWININDVLSLIKVDIAADDTDRNNDRLSMTIKLELREAVLAVINKMGQTGGSGFKTIQRVAGVFKSIIPQDVFLTVKIAPYNNDILPTFEINHFSEQTHKNTLIMINGILNTVKNTEGVDHVNSLLTKVDRQIKSVFKTIDKYVALDFEANNATMDTMKVMLTALKLDGIVTKVDLLYMVSYINTRDLSGFDSISYDKEAAGEFINKFKKNYAIDTNLDIATDTFLTDLGKSVKHIDANNINLDIANDQIDTIMSYDALIDIISATIKKPDAETKASRLNSIISKIEIRSLRLTDDTTDELTLLIKLPISSIVAEMMDGGASALTKHIASQLLPENLYIETTIQLNGEGVSIKVNGLEETESKALFGTIHSMMGTLVGKAQAEQFSYDGLCNTLSTEIKAAIAKVEDNKDAPIDLLFTSNGIDLPTIYELMQLILEIKGEYEGEEITPDTIRLTIIGSKESAGVDQSIINPSEGGDKLKPFDIKEEKMEARVVNGETRYYASGKPALSITDQAMNENAKVALASSESPDYAMTLIQTMFADFSPTAQPQSLLKSDNVANGFFAAKTTPFVSKTMIMTVEIELKMSSDVDHNNNLSVLPEKLYATIIADIENVESGRVDFYINDMGLINTKVIEKMMSALAKKEVSLTAIVQEMLDKFKDQKLSIEYSERSVNVPNLGVISDVAFENESLGIEDISALGLINNSTNIAEGLGRFIIDRVVEIDVTELVKKLIADQYPGGLPGGGTIPPDVVIPPDFQMPATFL